MPDVKQLISEVAAENGILIEPNDPLFALVTMNRLVLDEAARKLQDNVKAQMDQFHTNVQKAERLGGNMLGQVVKEAAEKMREGLKSDIQIAGLRATEFVNMVHEAHRRPTLARCCALGLMAAVLLFGCGLWLGLVLH